MPEFWEFPTVSMGLGPLAAIYQARFNRYLHHRAIKDTSSSRVWAFLGDGECDEPEALGALHVAAREGLDNLTFVVNCNLQRLDGPVRGNGKIIQELESVFRGSGWNVIKVLWSREWDDLLARDVDGVLVNRMAETTDGESQRMTIADGAYIREHFFGTDPRLRKLVEHLSDEQLRTLRRGGHDYRKVYAAYHAAVRHTGAPTAILAQTVKGWALGPSVEARNITHQAKKMSFEELKIFRDRLQLPISDDKLTEDPPYYLPGPDSPEIQYMIERRRALGGFVPKRVVRAKPLAQPDASAFAEFPKGSGTAAASTTMAFTRLLRNLLRDKNVGKRIVPIIPDEARTFGMDPLFKEVGTYSPLGQRDRGPHDAQRRRPAARGRTQSRARDRDPECPRVRPGVRVRDRRHRARRHQADAGRRRGHLLLPHAVQRELPAAADARRRGGGHRPRDLSLPARRRGSPPSRHAPRIGLDHAPGPSRPGGPPGEVRGERGRVQRSEERRVGKECRAGGW